MAELRYGDFMLPLCASSLDLPAEMRIDPEVARYIDLLDTTMRAEKVSDPDSWTPEESSAYERGDWQEFSRLRGYTTEEIRDFKLCLELTHTLIEKYGEDDVCWIDYAVQEQTGILGLTPQQLLSSRSV